MSTLTHVEEALDGAAGTADPLAGEDELWAEEDFLYTPDEEEYVGFVRTLWVAIFACALLWVAITFGAVQLLAG